MEQIIELIDSGDHNPVCIADIAQMILKKQVNELTPRDVLFLLAKRKQMDACFPSEIFAAAILELLSSTRHAQIRDEIAKLTARVEQLTQQSASDDPVSSTPPASSDSADAQPGSLDPATSKPDETIKKSSVYDDWVEQNIDEVKNMFVGSWSDDNKDRFVCEYLAINGLLNILKEAPSTEGVAVCAAQAGQLHILQWMVESDHAFDVLVVFGVAGYNGHVNILEYLHETFPDMNFAEINHVYCTTAASFGHLDTIKWFAKIGKIEAFTIQECANKAAFNGQFDVVKHLIREYPIPNALEVAKKAAFADHLMVLQLLFVRGLIGSQNIRALLVAAKPGSSISQWLRGMIM